MAVYITPGRSKVYWMLTLTSASAPSATQIIAGVELSSALRGIPSIPRTGNLADSADLSSTFEKRVRGTVGGDAMTLTLNRNTSTETAYNALTEGAEGYVVVFRKGVAGTQAAIGDKCDVFSGIINAVGDNSPGRNDVDSVNIEIAITDNPTRDKTVIT